MARITAALLLAVLWAAPAAAVETILVVGDSHTAGSFGQRLDGALRADAGSRVATYGVCSASPQSYLSETEHSCGYLFRDFGGTAPAKWLGGRVRKSDQYGGKGGRRQVTIVKTPELAQLLSDHVPTVAVIALGSNGLTADSVRRTLEAVHKSGAACVWIGPPDMRKPSSASVDAIYAILRGHKVVETATLAEARADSCRLIDSRAFPYLRYPAEGGDGTHYNGQIAPLAVRWGADAAAAVLAAFRP
jgi:lysophospholipase L1-like esterase